jgi:hypothetical protein
MDRVLRANPQLAPAVDVSLALSGCKLPEAVRTPLISTEPGVLLWHEVERAREGPSQQQSSTRLLALAIKALDATLSGTTLRRLSWIEPGAQAGAAEAFPRLDRYAGLAQAAPAAAFEGVARFAPRDNNPGHDNPANDNPGNTNPGDDNLGHDDPGNGPAAAAGDAMRLWQEITFAIEFIDPHRAVQYLAHNTGNRRISRAHVEAIARDLTQGRWMFNAQPICFARGGRLLNGQHRLRAVILAGREIEVPVVRGLDEAAYATYDSHAKRRADLGDRADSFGDQALAYAMANLLWRCERKALSTRNAKATSAEIQQIIAEHPRLLMLRSYARKMGHCGRASVIGYAAYVIERDDAALAPRFLAALETGVDQQPGHPVLALRGALHALRDSKASQAEQLAALLAGWERFKARAHQSAR